MGKLSYLTTSLIALQYNPNETPVLIRVLRSVLDLLIASTGSPNS